MRLQLDTALTGNGVAGSAETGQASAVGSSRAARTNGGGSGGDSIQISGPSSALSQLSTDRAARLQQLTAIVQGGSYQVSGAQVSRALVEHALSGTE